MAAGTRQELLDGAIEAIASRGLGRLTVDDVARAAGVSRQTVYRYFGSRDGLIDAVIVHEEAQLLARLTAVAERHDQALPALHEALVAADGHPLLQRLLASATRY